MAFNWGNFAGGLSEGIETAENIRDKAADRRAKELQTQAAQDAIDDAAKAKAVGLATPMPGAVLPPGYNQQTALQAVAEKFDADKKARQQGGQSIAGRVFSALTRPKVGLTASSAGVGAPVGLNLPGVPVNTGATPLPVGQTTSAAEQITGAAPPAPAAPAAPAPAAPAAPLPVGQDTTAAEQITGAAPAAPAAPEAPKPRRQTLEDGYMSLAYQARLKGDSKGAMEAIEKAGQLHSNSVLKSIRGASTATMSRVLTEIQGEPREVVEKDGTYTIRDANGKDIHTYPSFEAMYGDVKATVDDDPTIGIGMVMNANKDARDQAVAQANIRSLNATADKVGEETKWVGPKAKSEIGLQGAQADAAHASASASRSEAARGDRADKRAGQLFDYQLSDLKEDKEAKDILAVPSNAISQPEKWAWASKVNQRRYPTVKTSNEEVDSAGNVLRKQGNSWEEAGADYRTAFAKDDLVRRGLVKSLVVNDTPTFTYKKQDGTWATSSDPDEALHAAHKIWGGVLATPAPAGRGRPAAASAAPAAPAAPVLTPDQQYAADRQALAEFRKNNPGGRLPGNLVAAAQVSPQQRAAIQAADAAQEARNVADLAAWRKTHPGGRIPANLVSTAQRQGLGVH